MRLFFRNDDLGLAPSAFARLLALFDQYSHRLNAAVRPDLLMEAKVGLPAQEPEFLQVVAHGGDPAVLAASFRNFFPCFVGEGNPAGFPLTSSAKAGALPNFGVSFDLHSGARSSAKEIFRGLAARHEAGFEFTGVRLRHAEMTQEDFIILEELLHNLYKRSIPTSFFSDFMPGFERYAEADSGHV
jgi:hypothetical protein